MTVLSHQLLGAVQNKNINFEGRRKEGKKK
jgi:hypothetical protein